MYRVERNESIADGIFRMILSAPLIAPQAKAGQFINIYLPNGEMLLPRPFGIANADAKSIEIIYAVVGKGTERLSKIGAGESIRALGANGNGFDLDNVSRNVIVIGGGLGIAPLRFAVKQLVELGDTRVTVLLGYAADSFYADDIKGELSSDTLYTISDTKPEVSGALGITGNVMDLTATLIGRGELNLSETSVLACGPAPMLRAVCDWSAAHGLPAQISLEARMGCGYGACVGCSVKLRGEKEGEVIQKKVCVDGPVFSADSLIWDEQLWRT